MTTIIGVQGDGFAVICSDSRIADVEGSTAQIGTLREGMSKVALNGKYLLGAAGDVRAINILHHAFQPPPLPTNLKNRKLDQFITTKFVPSLRECFEAQGYAIPENNEEKTHIAEHSSHVLVSVNGTIYIIDGDYAWASDISGVYAIGSGASYALGAMQVLVRNKKLSVQQAKSHAIKALSVAAKYDPFTGAPYHTFVQGQETSVKRRKTV